MKTPARIILVEPSALVARGLAALLADNQQLTIVDTLSDCTHLSVRIDVLKPHIVLINPSVIEFKKQSAPRQLAKNLEEIAVVAFIYSHFNEQTLRQYDGVININDTPSQILAKLRNSLKINELTENRTDNYELSEREKEVLIAVAQGLMNKEIAEKLNISVHTVVTHRKNLTEKTGIKSIAGLTVYAILNNLIEA